LLWFWALWEAAQFCILSRLRTPLGKPQETLAAIEAAVKQCSAAIQDLDNATTSSSKTTDSSLQGLVLAETKCHIYELQNTLIIFIYA